MPGASRKIWFSVSMSFENVTAARSVVHVHVGGPPVQVPGVIGSPVPVTSNWSAAAGAGPGGGGGAGAGAVDRAGGRGGGEEEHRGGCQQRGEPREQEPVAPTRGGVSGATADRAGHHAGDGRGCPAR